MTIPITLHHLPKQYPQNFLKLARKDPSIFLHRGVSLEQPIMGLCKKPDHPDRPDYPEHPDTHCIIIVSAQGVASPYSNESLAGSHIRGLG